MLLNWLRNVSSGPLPPSRRKELAVLAGLPLVALVGLASGPTWGEGVPGCGPNSVTDIAAPRVPGRTVARCDPGAPGPKPLATRQKITVAVPVLSEASAPLYVAIAMKEFEKENLDVEVVTLSGADSFASVASGQVDIVYGTGPTLMNAVASGIDVRQAVAAYFPPHAGDTSVAQAGLWARKDVFPDPSKPDLSKLKGTVLASSVGIGTVALLPIQDALDKFGIQISDLTVSKVPLADMVQALRAGAAQSAWILDPFSLEAAQDPNLMLTVTFPVYPNGGMSLAGNLYDKRRDVGLAFTRAWLRTINTYLTGDYHENKEVMDALSKAIGVDAAVINKTPALVWDWEIPGGHAMRLQSLMMKYELLAYKDMVPENRLVDRSLYLEAVGAPKQ